MIKDSKLSFSVKSQFSNVVLLVYLSLHLLVCPNKHKYSRVVLLSGSLYCTGFERIDIKVIISNIRIEDVFGCLTKSGRQDFHNGKIDHKPKKKPQNHNLLQ